LELSEILSHWALAITTGAITTHTLDHTTTGTTDGVTILFTLHSHIALITVMVTTPITMVDSTAIAITILTDMVTATTTTITTIIVDQEDRTVEMEILLHRDTMDQATADLLTDEDLLIQEIRTATTNQIREEAQGHQLEQEVTVQHLIETQELVQPHLQPTADLIDLQADILTTMYNHKVQDRLQAQDQLETLHLKHTPTLLQIEM
jgi:hypothetical protein